MSEATHTGMENGLGLPALDSPKEVDTDTVTESSMNNDRLTEILVRLTQIDEGQKYMIERLGELRADTEQTRDKVGRLEKRVDQVEWSVQENKERLQPWRTFWFSIAASCAASLGTYMAIHLLTR